MKKNENMTFCGFRSTDQSNKFYSFHEIALKMKNSKLSQGT